MFKNLSLQFTILTEEKWYDYLNRCIKIDKIKYSLIDKTLSKAQLEGNFFFKFLFIYDSHKITKEAKTLYNDKRVNLPIRYNNY